MQIKEILASRNSKQTKPQNCPETSTANFRLVRVYPGYQSLFLLGSGTQGSAGEARFLREGMCL